MAKKKSRSGSRRRVKGERFAWAHASGFRASLMLAGGVIGLGAVSWGAAIVHARAGDILKADPVGVEMVWPTLGAAEQTWLGEGIREQIVARVDAQLVGRVLDAAALEAVGEMLASSGWFDGPPQVSRAGASTIRVAGRWREPACAVRAEGRDYPLDWQGRPFPIEYAEGESGLRVLVGVGAGVPLDGTGTLDVLDPWPGEDMEAGLGLLGPLLREPFASQVAGVDVSRYFSHGELSIVTDRGTRVVWGGRFELFVPGEATTEQKLGRLRAAAANPLYSNRIDSGAARLDISGEHLILDRTGTP